MSISPQRAQKRNADEEQSPKPIDEWSDLFCLFRLTGDDLYFAEILDGTSDEMQRHVEAVCRANELASDFAPVLLNEAALKLLSAALKFDCTKPLLPYFKSIVTNCGHDKARYEARRRAQSLSADRFSDNDVSTGYEPAAPASSDPARQVESQEAVQKIYAAVALLPEPDCRVMMAKIAGSHRRDIAEKFGYTPQQVSRILHRGRKRLRDELG